MFRVISEVRPTWVCGENVANLVRMGIDDMLSDMEGIGYATQTLVIPACAIGTPHRRDRVWILAYSDGVRNERGRVGARGASCDSGSEAGIWESKTETLEGYSEVPSDSDGVRELQSSGSLSDFWGRTRNDSWRDVEPTIRRGVHGLPRELDKGKRIKALGNAIVPQVAYPILKAIYDNLQAG